MYSKVIVPLDGSELAEKALAHAQLVAGALSIPIELVEAFEVPASRMHDLVSPVVLSRMLAEQRRRSQQYLSEMRERLQAAGHQVTATTLPGIPEQVVRDRAGADPDALVVMSTHGRSGVARWALGSVADRVTHTVSNPVLIVRAAAPKTSPPEIATVLAPLDGSDLAETSLEHAVNLAVALDAGISLVRVTHSQHYYRNHLAGSVATAGSPASGWINDLMRADFDAATDYLTETQRRLAAEHPESSRIDTLHLRHDSPAQAIIDQAGTQPTLVVMASHGRDGLGRLMLGSVTDRVVRHSNAPVLVVRNRE